jgi:VanZ family protein
MLKPLRWAALWALFILVLCLIPGKDLPHPWWADLLSFDKVVHAGVFAVLAYLVHGALHGNGLIPRQVMVWTLASCIVYGGLLELMKGSLMRDRYAEFADFLDNAVGAVAGAWWAARRATRAQQAT